MEITTLYVDSLLNNDSVGLTNDANTIAYNNSKIDKAEMERFTDVLAANNEASTLGFIGRYMYSIEMSLETKMYKMAFADLQQDENYAIMVANSLANEEVKELFMRLFFIQKETYNEYYNSVKLVKGKPPTSK